MIGTSISNKLSKSFKFSSLAMILVAMVLVGSGCSKDSDDDDDDNNNTQPTATTIPPIEDADGIMVGIKTISIVTQAGFEIETAINTGVAAFGDLNAGNLVDVGTVDIDAEVLEQATNNSYYYAPTTTNPTGLDFGSSYTWNVVGGNGFGGFSHTVSFPFPTIGKITSATGTISSASAYTLSVQNVADADSVIFQIVGSSGTPVLVTKAGNATSHTFTAAEVASVGNGTGIIQVAAYTLDNANKGGKTIYFVNESVVSEIVEFE